jgi:hypothetical protein
LEKRRCRVWWLANPLKYLKTAKPKLFWKSLAKTSLALGWGNVWKNARRRAIISPPPARDALERDLGQPGIQRASGNDHCEGTNGFRI